MMPESFQLIVITPEQNIIGEAGNICRLFESGLEILHFRKPSNTIEEMRVILDAIPAIFHSKIVIHNHYELLNEFDLKGAHLPERLRKEGNTANIKNTISTSFHRLDDILAEQPNFKYAFFSPVFPSISKKGYKPVVELEIIKDFLKHRKSKIPFPMVALGGVTDKNILQARDVGFNGVALIGHIWESANPVGQFNKLQERLAD